MDQPSATKMFIFVGLSVCCVIFGLYEILKRIELTAGKLVALGISGGFVLAISVAGWSNGHPTLTLSAIGMVALPMGLILFGDILGDMTGIRMGLVSRTTPGSFVGLLGWVFLLGLIAFSAYDAVSSGSQ